MNTLEVEIIEGNLLDSPAKYIAHQTNCISRRSAHLAAAVFDEFPYADIYSCRTKGQIDKPGTIVVRGNGDDERYVINMLGQVYPGRSKFAHCPRDGAKARQGHFFNCLKEIASIPELGTIAFPFKIGCGAAGGSWPLYHHLIKKFAKHIEGKAEAVIVRLPE